MCQRISVEAAAKELGCRPQLVRIKMQKHALGKQDGWDLGEAIRPDKATGQQHWTYYIYLAKLDKHLGKATQPNSGHGGQAIGKAGERG